MSGVSGAIIGGAVIGAGASVYGGNQAAGAARSASRRSEDTQRYFYDTNRDDLAPYREAGYEALGSIEDLYLGTPQERERAMRAFRTSPQYQFVRDEGIRGLTNSASARGGQLSGNALAGTAQFSSGLASGEFGSYVDRLFGIAGLGGNATAATGAAGSSAANSLTNVYTNEGNLRGSAYLAGAQGVNNAVQGGLQNWAFNQYRTGNTGNATTGNS